MEFHEVATLAPAAAYTCFGLVSNRGCLCDCFAVGTTPPAAQAARLLQQQDNATAEASSPSPATSPSTSQGVTILQLAADMLGSVENSTIFLPTDEVGEQWTLGGVVD